MQLVAGACTENAAKFHWFNSFVQKDPELFKPEYSKLHVC